MLRRDAGGIRGAERDRVRVTGGTGGAMADFEDLLRRLSNRGRWGEGDERGALNYITEEKRRRAAGLVRHGRVFSLSIPVEGGRGPQRGLGGRVNPLHFMTATGCDPSGQVELGHGCGYTDDFLAMTVQGGTQWDALCHVFYDGELYNGHPASSVTSRGAARNGIEKAGAGFVSRGVLLDVARQQGVGCLEPGYAIRTAELEAVEKAQGVAVESGDIVLVRTGQMSTVGDFSNWSAFHGKEAGLHWETAEWLHERQVAAVAADNSMVEASRVLEGVAIPFHMLALRNLGIHLGEFWYLERLAEDCASDGVFEFLLVAQALPIVGGTGSPVNPLALK
jgi:kynurenine formamidase